MWFFVGMLLGSMVTSSHDTKEACEGRRVVLAEKGVNGQCVQQQGVSSTGTFTINPTIYCQNTNCR